MGGAGAAEWESRRSGAGRAPTAAATSVVSAAAASTTQWAVMRRVGRDPRGLITNARIPHSARHPQLRCGNG
jgi:hypothetical protein